MLILEQVNLFFLNLFLINEFDLVTKYNNQLNENFLFK
jgi:hypothetical protein